MTMLSALRAADMASTASAAVTALDFSASSLEGRLADRQQVVLAVGLHAVAGVEQQPDAALGLERAAELTDRILHAGLVGVGLEDHLEARAAQRVGHVARVVGRIVELGDE